MFVRHFSDSTAYTDTLCLSTESKDLDSIEPQSFIVSLNDDFNNIDSATKKILSFTNFCGNEFKPYWNVYILKNNERIYPFDNFNESEDEVLKTTREEYNNLLKRYYAGEKYIAEHLDEYDKYLPVLLDIETKINNIIEIYNIKDSDIILNGFRNGFNKELST